MVLSSSFSSSVRRDRLLAAAVASAWTVFSAWAAYTYLRPWPDVLLDNDFISFLTGGSLAKAGVGPGLFDLETQRAFQEQLCLRLASVQHQGEAGVPGRYFYYPAPLALLFAPLTLLPVSWSFVVWSAISLVAFVVAVALPLRGHPLGRTLALALLSYLAVLDSLLEGQVNGLFLLIFSLSLLAFTQGRSFLGGLLLGAMLLKPQYAALFPVVFLLKRRWRELEGMAVAGAVIAGMSVVMVGVDGTFMGLNAVYEKGVSYPPPLTMVNWRALLANLWPDLLPATGSAPVLALGAVTALASLLAWRGRWDPTSPRFPRQMLALTLATILATPHSHFHGTVLLLAPLALALSRSWERVSPPWGWGVTLAAGYLLAFVSWPLRIGLMVPYLTLALVALVFQCWREGRPG